MDLKLNDAVQLVDFVLYDNKADDYDYYHDLLKDLCDLIHDTLPKLDSVKLLDLLVTLNGFKNAIVHSVIEEIVERLGRAKYSKTIGDYMLKTKGFQAIKLGSNYVEEERISENGFCLIRFMRHKLCLIFVFLKSAKNDFLIGVRARLWEQNVVSCLENPQGSFSHPEMLRNIMIYALIYAYSYECLCVCCGV